MLSERRYKGPYSIWFHLHGMSRICKFLETESSLIVGYGEEWGEMRSDQLFMGTDFFWKMIKML